MKIYFTPGQDPMLLDSLKAMNAIHDKLQAFLSSPSKSFYLEASQRGGPEPYDELLAGLEIHKGDGPINLSLTSERRLHLVGSPDNLSRYFSFFKFREDEQDNHHHPEYVKVANYITKGTMSLIVETDSDYEEREKLS
jgi:hypothetical protein